MYKNEIKEIFSQKREYNLYLLKEYIIIYFNLLLLIKNSGKVRLDLTEFIHKFYINDRTEKEILLCITKYFGKHEYIPVCEKLLEHLDEIFFRQFNYNEYILNGYYDAIETQNIYRATITEQDFEVISETDKVKIIDDLHEQYYKINMKD